MEKNCCVSFGVCKSKSLKKKTTNINKKKNNKLLKKEKKKEYYILWRSGPPIQMKGQLVHCGGSDRH
jgi:hypothetical protein